MNKTTKLSSSPALRGSSSKSVQGLQLTQSKADVIIPCVAGQFFEERGL